MPVWEEILKEMREIPSALDAVRRKYLSELSEYTQRNTIAYYSGWLHRGGDHLDINDYDMNGFMCAIHNLDKTKGLDLILHTPGGSPVASEAIVKYLRSIFGTNIRVIVPQLAMSAGTLIACSSKEIIMGNQSSLGPVDPQYNGIPAYNVILEFETAKNDLSQNTNIAYWQMLLSKYPPAFVLECQNSIDLSDKLLEEWLLSGMFCDDADAQSKIKQITEFLNEHKNSKSHSRHFNADDCISIGLKISKMEDDQMLQDLILSVHHSYIQTFSETPVAKIIENNIGKALVKFSQK